MSASSARKAILEALRRAMPPQTASCYRVPPPPAFGDLERTFARKAQESGANIHELGGCDAVPQTMPSLLGGSEARLHIPFSSPLRVLPWEGAPQIELSADAPGAEDDVLTEADFGIAETGTLVFLAGGQPASWHFLPGRAFVLLSRKRLLAHLEDLFTRMGGKKGLPSTVNLVTGPSRTADIEQTIVRGAHGPRALHILLVP